MSSIQLGGGGGVFASFERGGNFDKGRKSGAGRGDWLCGGCSGLDRGFEWGWLEVVVGPGDGGTMMGEEWARRNEDLTAGGIVLG